MLNDNLLAKIFQIYTKTILRILKSLENVKRRQSLYISNELIWKLVNYMNSRFELIFKINQFLIN